MIMIIYFVIGSFRGTFSSVNMLKGYMIRERLGTPVLVVLQHHLATAFWFLQFHSLDARGLRPVCPPLHATGYDGLLSESLNHVWASQAMLAMYEIENKRKVLWRHNLSSMITFYYTTVWDGTNLYNALFIYIVYSRTFNVINSS